MSDQWLHLFTSNIRDLYIADAVDLLGAPEGLIYQFRYQEEHVQEAARALWNRKKGGLARTNVLVYFSVQHAANFHRAAYVPLRYGKVVDAFIEGRTYIVKFKLDGYASLRQPHTGEQLFQVVREFSDEVRKQLEPSYPDYVGNQTGRDQRRSATLSGPPTSHNLDPAGDEGAKFERVVDYISPALGPQFPRIFFRVASVWKGESTSPEHLTDQGYLDLTAGNHYRIDVAFYQVASPSEGTMEVATPSGLSLLTAAEYPIRSRYDVLSIRLFAPFRDDEIQGEIAFRVKKPGLGTNVQLPIRIKASMAHRAGYPALAISGAFVALIPSLLGTDTKVGYRLGIAFVGASLIGLGVWARKSRGLSG